MNHSIIPAPDPKLDLAFERVVDVPRELVWKAWTTPEHLKKWFTPAPWTTVDCEIELRPGGMFKTVMRSPEGHTFPNVGCYLEIVENEKLVFTNAFTPGFRPATPAAEDPKMTFFFTAVVTLQDAGLGTKYTAMVIHGDPESCQKHKNMGFEHGWSAALDQLVAMIKGEQTV